MLEVVAAAYRSIRRFVEVPWAEVPTGFDYAWGSGIGNFGLKFHRLADASAAQVKLAEVPFHRLLGWVFAQDVQFGSICLHRIDHETCKMYVLFGLGESVGSLVA